MFSSYSLNENGRCAVGAPIIAIHTTLLNT